MDQEVYENVVASFVDIGSILAAYLIGLHQLGIEFGVLYALFDAWLVVWMRKPLSRTIKQAFHMAGARNGVILAPLGYRASERPLLAVARRRRGLARIWS